MDLFELDRGDASRSRARDSLCAATIHSACATGRATSRSKSNSAAWADLTETVRTGKAAFPRVHGRSVWQWFAEHPDEERVFAGGMRAGTTQDAPFIVNGYRWPERRRHLRRGRRASCTVRLRMPPANRRSSSGCSPNHCHTELPFTRGNDALPERTVSVRSDHAAVVDLSEK